MTKRENDRIDLLALHGFDERDERDDAMGAIDAMNVFIRRRREKVLR